MIRTIFLLLAVVWLPAAAVADSCTDCYQEGLDARQRGEMKHALQFFEHGCNQDDGGACNAAAHMVAKGEGAPRDPVRVMSLGLRSCDLGYWQGCRDLGVGTVRSEDPVVAANGRELLARSCEGGIASGCGALGTSLLRGYGGSIDQVRGILIMARACELGFPPGCTSYGASFLGGDAADLVRARSLVKRGCDGGDPKGCGYLGVALRDGIGGPVDVAGSNGYLERACEGGFLPFCSDLAAALVKGTGGIEVDLGRAATLFETACNGGYQNACENFEILAKAGRKKAPEEPSEGWSMSAENFSFSTREEPTEEGGSNTLTTIGSMKVGQGSETATFSDVRASCGMLQLTQAFGSAAAPLRQCLASSDTRRVTLMLEDGRITSSSVDPDDTVGRCVMSALGRAHLAGLTCKLEAGVSR
jgi:TPR repeat protein